MKKRTIYSLLLCIFLAACGTDGSEEEQSSASGDPVSHYLNSREAENSMAGDSANNEVDANGDSQSNIMENPAYSALGRQVLIAVVTTPLRETLDRIIAFNESSPDYFIEVKGYGGGANSFENLETQLPLEILSGKGPDMVIWGSVNYSPALASERLMEDLYDFMDADPDFHREDYYENILQAFEKNGGLYVLPASFTVETGCVRADELEQGRGVAEGWTLGEMMEAYKSSSYAERFSTNFTREFQLWFICEGCMGNFIDWSSGECRFDTPEFAELLEFCNTFPEELAFPEDYNAFEYLRSGKIFWQRVKLGAPWNVAYHRVSNGDTDMLWPGYLVTDGEKTQGGGVAAPLGECFSICQNSVNQEAAWEVIKSFLTEDAQRGAQGIPLLRSVSEERIQDALTVEYEMVDGVKQEKIKHEEIIGDIDAVTLEFSCITEQDAETYRSIIENTHRSCGSDSGILDIIMEEAGAYFGGNKDAATVADIIQNRVSMYVAERM